ncbi:hypothetical protein SDC9_31620 [bioreactor metagenome]|uniref:Replication-associated protein G2P N-terminal domain-containing protein n=1 Tax=bioreactor metagenome TaxID=1076179 RepID=A0A644V2U0_9ZZZZ
MFDTIDIMLEPPERESCGIGLSIFKDVTDLAKDKKYRTLHVRFTKDGSVIVSFSIPSVLFGSSISEYFPSSSKLLLEEVAIILHRLKITVSYDRIRVCRLDICRNIAVPRPASAYICHVAKYSAIRAETVHTSGTSTMFRWSKFRSLQFYDKLKKEVQIRDGNLLRIELRLGNSEQVRKYTQIRTLNDVFRYTREQAEKLLYQQTMRVIGINPPFFSPDLEAVWREASRIVDRGKPGYYIAFLLGMKLDLTPADYFELGTHLKSHISRDRFREEKKRLLRPISTGPMDHVFRLDVVNKLRSGSPRLEYGLSDQ